MKKTMWAMVAVIIVLFGVVVWGFMEYVYEPRESVDLTQEDMVQEDVENKEDEDDEDESEGDEEAFDPESVENKRNVAEAYANGDIIYTDVVERHSVKLLEPYLDAIKDADSSAKYSRGITEDYLFNYVDIFEVGVVNDGEYAGYKLVTMAVACEGPCSGIYDYKFLYNEDKGEFVFLSAHSNTDTDFAPFLEPLFSNSSSMFLDGLEIPNSLTLPNGETIYLKQSGVFTPSSVLNFLVVKNDPTYGKIYYQEGLGCYYYLSPDNVVSRYDLNLSFVDPAKGDYIGMPDGRYLQLNEDYQLQQGGCGIEGGCFNIYEVDESNLKSVGKSAYGKEFFIPIKYDEAGTHFTYKSDITIPAGLYDMHLRYGNGADSGISYDEYMNQYPVLFWKDPLGRWSTLINNDYAPLAECGKPVVYLYPEQKMTVAVKVLLDELTVTIPEHGKDGWTVEASPNGKLLNLEDGKTYDYLFWEGHKESVLEANQGFMVEKSNVKKFLRSSLKQMGLNKTERNDFMEFWVPVMQSYEHPKFFVSFVGTEEFNKVAPLEITPSPDTLYRIFMYFEPTYQDREVVPQVLNSFDRKGFTVVEWGGTSSIPWK